MLNAQFFTDTGQYRDKNEDAGGVFYNRTEQQLLVLCDGMGGHLAGEVASQFVTRELQQRFEEENLIEADQAETWLKTTLKAINRELYDKSVETPEYQGMGTTCVCALVFDNYVVVANIGDSRAYLVNSREIEQITNDHSFVNHLVMIGQISAEEAYTHPQRNIITKVMGTDRLVTPDIFVKKTKFYDYLMLNSDGLTDFVRNHKIQEALLQDNELETQGQYLIELALTEGTNDNVSLVLAEVEGDKV
ncbi:Stp1/IreP family PP2C-type Ser/Thr phosphatase [Staphylococcus xylosus]|uniref:Stp1/IreP family PP2C-type Ser/Thr phosphatase n=1 Tax=Staphylococcus xylosus TaxID=1288 RepID=UPI0004105506|nr:Stp1/IreP family PP2C-type Ser/Thr phosphatase [Staphylococcus xylosus]MCD8851565.1 Stp1/IreP family PP2C-type Ser/Thr phosphatase [Staphylococcus xylosus]MDG5480735.1 Stp1/IreP family PP2C-type Ser/Thr phosphatase [Staphylococcus xylosus]MEB7507840.1 Stp1/IreP family PP2C-type Ser/Thr phosphatase [Staphylococcus xylosus]MEB7856698.1 Stp1/IreP family PP2C-type Ser/Thr phosphatase [Staphylococcus xylosus]